MISAAVRRVVLTTQQTPITSSLSSIAPCALASQSLSRVHQRRYSSSKPSSPSKPSNPAPSSPSNAKGVADGQVPTNPSQPSKRRAKNANGSSTLKSKDERSPNYPSVPNTNHISPGHIAASNFFSLYRPISLTTSFPKAISDDAFAAIFTPRTIANTRPADVISTLSSTVQDIESVVGGLKRPGSQQARWNAETDELRASINAESNRKPEVQHLDSLPVGTAMEFPRHILSNYQPFQPPPAPLPRDSAESLAAGVEAAETQEPQHRTYTTVVTLEESTNEHGEVTWLAHSSPIQEYRPLPTRFLERMQIRQERFRERAEESALYAISVKRQRKLKMKKHKYKKLMRRTRNLRRRLDRN